MGWYEQIQKVLGLKKGIGDLSEEELRKAINQFRIQTDKYERKIGEVDEEVKKLAAEVLRSNKLKAGLLMEKIKVKKASAGYAAQAYLMSMRQLAGLEAVRDIRQLTGGKIDSKLSKLMETVSPTELAAFIDTQQDMLRDGLADTEDIYRTLEKSSRSVNQDLDRADSFKQVEFLQDAEFTDGNVSEEEKIRRIIEMA